MSSGQAAAGRYAAQIANRHWGEGAQRALGEAAVFIVGAGALGGVAAAYLAAAGVGRLAIVDGGTVAPEDLHRQILYLTPEVGMSKADSLAAKLALLNPEVHADPFPADLTADNAALILEGAGCVLDCGSDAAVRLLVNDACVASGTPFSTVATAGFDAAVLTVLPGRTACCRCIGEDAGDGSDFGLPRRTEAGVFGPPAGAAASLQALAAIGLLTGALDPRAGVLLRLRGDALEWTARPVTRRPDCICANGEGDGTL